MTPSLEGWPTKAKEAPSPHEVGLALPDTKVSNSQGRLESILYIFFIHFVKFLCDFFW